MKTTMQNICCLRFFSIGLLLAVSNAFGQQPIDWKTDIEYLRTELPKKHVKFFSQLKKADYEAECDKVITMAANNPSYGKMATEVMRLVALTKDSHTGARADFTQLKFYPFNARVFDDGVFVVAAPESNSNMFGAQLVSVGDIKIDTLTKNFGKLFGHENRQQLINVFGNNSNVHEFLIAAGAKTKDDSMPLELKKDGKTFNVDLKAVSLAGFRRTRFGKWKAKVPLYAKKKNLDYWNDWIAEHRTVYFKYNRCKNLSAFARLVSGTKGFIQQKDVDKFVIDLRNNGGGNSQVFKPLLNYLKENKDLNQKGKLFAIVGRQTFSSGIWAALDLRRETNAIIVGEPTGGKPNHFGEIKFVTLPNSKIRISYSTRYWHMLKDSDPESVEPDLKVKFTSKDYFSGSDPYLKAVLDHKEKKK